MRVCSLGFDEFIKAVECWLIYIMVSTPLVFKEGFVNTEKVLYCLISACAPQVKYLVRRFPTQVTSLPLLSTIEGSAGKLIVCLLQLNPAMIVGECPKYRDVPKSVRLDVVALNVLKLHMPVSTAE